MDIPIKYKTLDNTMGEKASVHVIFTIHIVFIHHGRGYFVSKELNKKNKPDSEKGKKIRLKIKKSFKKTFSSTAIYNFN